MVSIHIRRISFIGLLFCLLGTEPSRACTIFYVAKDGVILAGNNEDWEDPATKMWIYPPEGGKHGWIKFGFGSGFPQGGMNDQGLFWDATAGPYLDMPYSTSSKTIYTGPLMKKVIEESSNVAEAESILQTYYCEDQFKAQYLIGDASGYSMISEGDSILRNYNNHQVLTNFYQSNPDLGGYPCWRYENAMELLEKCDTITPYYIGSILASTHQEGRYPTQYSNIYDLKQRRVYLFYYHNYDEFLSIDLQNEMEAGYQSYDIPSIFSKVELLQPGNGEELPGDTATISWSGLPDNSYTILYSTDSDMSDPLSVEVIASRKPNEEIGMSLSVVPLIFFAMLVLVKRNRKGLFVGLLSLVLMNMSCERDQIQEEKENTVEHNATLTDLQSLTTYYWKIEAKKGNTSHFTTETVIRSFKTGD